MKKIALILLALIMIIPAAVLPVSADTSDFNDVKDGMWFYTYVDFCHQRGYMNGVSETEFAPHETLTRAMFVTIIAAVEHYDKQAYTGHTGFDDVPEDAWFAAPVKWANENGIVSGRGEGIFDPGGKVTRQEMTLMLYKFAISKGIDVSNEEDLAKNPDRDSVAEWAKDAVRWAISTKVMIGSVRGMIMPADYAERCDVAVIIKSFVTRVLEAKPATNE